jgi:hypothetical protein
LFDRDSASSFGTKKSESNRAKKSNDNQAIKQSTKRKISSDTKEKEPDYPAKKAKRIYENLSSRTFKLYYLFLKAAIPVFDTTNQLLQNETHCIHVSHDSLKRLLENILTRFVKPTAMKGSPKTVNFVDRANQKEDQNLSIGIEAKQFIKENPSIDTESFYNAVRSYFVLCAHICAKIFHLVTKYYCMQE